MYGKLYPWVTGQILQGRLSPQYGVKIELVDRMSLIYRSRTYVIETVRADLNELVAFLCRDRTGLKQQQM